MRKLILFFFLFYCTLSVFSQNDGRAQRCPNILHEVRAVWLTTLMGLDWPSRPAKTLEQTEEQKQTLCTMLDKLKEVGINTVLFQSRIRSTTAYQSAYEPWDGVFTGHNGKKPLYDPLHFVVEECHKRGMECHAWVVAFPICKVTVGKQLGRQSLPSKHPELCQKCGDQWMMDPGVPATASYLAAICKEIVENYEVDGIHLDYIRYPEKTVPFNDSRTYKMYGGGESKPAWRKHNVDRCVQAIHDAVKALKPWVKLSCSPVGKYSDLPRQSSNGWNARDAVSQDAQRWLEKGWMDMLFPMMYFDGNHFYPFLADWKENDKGHPIVPGLGIYFLNQHEKNWPLLTIQRQLNVIRQIHLGGYALFRAKFLLNNEKGLYDWLKNQFNARQALVPPMKWLRITPPESPQVTKSIEGGEVKLSWQDSNVQKGRNVYYNVYRTDSVFGDRIIADHVKADHYHFVPSLPALLHSRYSVTAVDVYGNESPNASVQ